MNKWIPFSSPSIFPTKLKKRARIFLKEPHFLVDDEEECKSFVKCCSFWFKRKQKKNQLARYFLFCYSVSLNRVSHGYGDGMIDGIVFAGPCMLRSVAYSAAQSFIKRA